MSHLLRILAIIVGLLGCLSLARAAENALPERGAAVTDPSALSELDGGSFALGRVLAPPRQADTPLTNSELFALPSMAPVRQALDREFDHYVDKHKAELPNESIGVGDSLRLPAIRSRNALFRSHALCAVGHHQPDGPRLCLAESCGEIRLIYRLTRTDLPQQAGDDTVSPRLPMTLNVVLKAKGDPAVGRPRRCDHLRGGCTPMARHQRLDIHRPGSWRTN